MGRLTTHVLDTAQGRPADGLHLSIYAVQAGVRRLIKSTITNESGRTHEPLLDEVSFAPGTYEIVFDVGDYFSRSPLDVPNPPFLDDVAIKFHLGASEIYHVPLLVSPWSYSTYRGS